jgi:hypothetical protein
MGGPARLSIAGAVLARARWQSSQPFLHLPCSASLPSLQLTWFTQPYITRLRYTPSTDTLEATTLSLWAQPRTDRFHVAEVAEAASVHPLTTFQARGRRYYIDAGERRRGLGGGGAQPRLPRATRLSCRSAGRPCPMAACQARPCASQTLPPPADHFADKALLARLQPAATAAHVVEAAEAAAQRQQQQEQQEQRSQQGENAQ